MEKWALSSIVFLIVALTIIDCSGPGSRPMSFQELSDMDIFPKMVGDKWDLDGEPCPALVIVPGYIHAIYNHTERFGFLKIWVIDKCTPDNAELWLTKLLDGGHTAESVKPLPPITAAEENKEYYRGFLNSPVTVAGGHGYEYATTDENGSIAYGLYYTRGRFVVGVEDCHGRKNVEEIHKSIYPVLESLNLSR